MARLTISLLAATTLLATLSAAPQVPDGWYVLSHTGTAGIGGGGLTLMSPRTGAPSVPLLYATGLPPELTGLTGGSISGAGGVAIDQASGDVFVGEVAGPGTSIELHRVRLTVIGNTATATVVGTTFVGVVDNQGVFGGIRGLARLPDGDLVLALRNLAAQPPLQGNRLARFHLGTGAVTPIVTNAVPGTVDAVAFDPTNSTLVFHVQDPTMGPVQGYLYRCPLAGGTAQVLRQIAAPTALDIDSTRKIHFASSTYSLTLDAAGATLSSFLFNASAVGVAVERATDQPVYFVSDPYQLVNGGIFLGPAMGRLTSYAVPRTGSGIAIQQDPTSYGAGSAAGPSFTWQLPLSGGLPIPGNTAFALQVKASDASTPIGLLCASPLAGNVSVLGVTALLDLNSCLVLGTIAAGSSLPLPIPAGIPAGLQMHFQAVFADAAMPAGIATSNAMRLVLIR